MRVLNLYACVGGNRKFWNADVTAVEYDPKIAAVYQKLYPNDVVVMGDAHQYLLEHYTDFDFIWSSPPCQSHSRMIRSGRNRKPRFPDLKLYEEVIFLQSNFSGKWVVENVVPYYEPLIPATRLGRHLFWANFHIGRMQKIPEFPGFISATNMQARRDLMDWLGIHFDEVLYCGDNHCPAQVLRNCVHPDMGLHVFECAMQKDLFGEMA